MLNLKIFNKIKSKIHERSFRKLLQKAEKVLNIRGVLYIELTFVSEVAIKNLNKLYRHKNYATDVISLSYFGKKMDDPFVGEIFICVPFARKQAKKLNHELKQELEFLFVHGLLHVFGYDHKTPAQSKLMRKMEEKIMV